MTSKLAPRSPYISSSTLPVNVPGTRSPYPSKSILLPSSGLPSPTLPNVDSHLRSTSSTPSSFSSSVLDVLSPGDVIGEGLGLQGSSNDEPARTFEVVKKLGTGSYAVVYLVREVLYRAPEREDRYEDDGADLDMSMDGYGDVESIRSRAGFRVNEYGREYAIKLLSKANLDTEALEAQVLEAQIHQSLPKHPNIVSLHRVLDTPAFLLLVLEFVPGEDLFYFLEQTRDHYEPPHLLYSRRSRHRRRSWIAQSQPSSHPAHHRHPMCDAVATCHERGVFHRDIKSENFIVTDGMMEVREPRMFGEGEEQTTEIVMKRERKVVVKLTDFGLSTNEMHSGDMDCGSAPYMSFECPNNVHDTYMPRAADARSLGIVLINMLYHHKPWTNAAFDVCPSFTLFRQNPTYFFLSRFSGMTPRIPPFPLRSPFLDRGSAIPSLPLCMYPLPTVT
ncbi:kinase-like domain-containing protein [Irpex rosettiformis]|uniref:Kinase-like domain-containing protein n=1 Tax=Irpex rosettiformis TaxID=378272 RepID=A0ACB8TPQ1_9APHY|nr:kinase-like domain-containing protein [Irpex rosettiformis]